MQILNGRKWLVGVSAVVCSGYVFFGGALPASAATYAGMIGKYDKEPPCFILRRDQKNKEAPTGGYSGMPLYVGDELRLQPSTNTCEVPVVLGQSEPIMLTIEKPSYIVRDNVLSPPTSELAGVNNSITDWWDDIWGLGERRTRDTQNMSGVPSQQEDLRMPLLTGSPPVVLASTNLYLGWKGGNNPSVEVKASCGDTKLTLLNILQDHQEATLELKNVKAGQTCELTVTGLEPVQFKVVSETEWQSILKNKLGQPTFDAVGKLDLKKPENAIWYASLLARHQELRLQAYQQVVGITNYYPAELVKIGLKRGIAFKNKQ